ncbi:hypothetical protein M5D96_009442 [Drosophila gunungcola]|uniref:Uncharacterized protein n=1 Tax=Drosophila gunungcola TaxID=103775 RepID=A0A9Q0BN42_9MUSC|nr:hypothetical protein M5D96_009442 [Drosophila gunungcola]
MHMCRPNRELSLLLCHLKAVCRSFAWLLALGALGMNLGAWTCATATDIATATATATSTATQRQRRRRKVNVLSNQRSGLKLPGQQIQHTDDGDDGGGDDDDNGDVFTKTLV